MEAYGNNLDIFRQFASDYVYTTLLNHEDDELYCRLEAYLGPDKMAFIEKASLFGKVDDMLYTEHVKEDEEKDYRNGGWVN